MAMEPLILNVIPIQGSLVVLYTITGSFHHRGFSLWLFQTLEPKSGLLFDVFFCNTVSTNLLFILHIKATDRKPACCVYVVLFGRLTHTRNLMHGVSFLPLTAPLAPADINWIRKHISRLYTVW